MRKLQLIIIALLVFPCCLYAQRGRARKPQKSIPQVSLSQLLDEYRFEEAESQLTKDIATLRRKKTDTSQAEALLRMVQRAKIRMNATEKICFIDSLVVSKSEVLPHIYLAQDNGTIAYHDKENLPIDSLLCTSYQSQFGDIRLYAQPNEWGYPLLYKQTSTNGTWSAPIALTDMGLGQHGDTCQNFPYMLNDGLTLYYAAKGEESLGGYDIFMTRYNAESKSFFAPENIGMPFNSTANDYLYAVDEVNNVGWFATDRQQHKDSVCIYTFIPNAKRTLYNTAEIDNAQLRNYARIHRIADTWTEEKQESIVRAKANIQSTKEQLAHATLPHEDAFALVISDDKILTHQGEASSATARQLLNKWEETLKRLKQEEGSLERMREGYTAANSQMRQDLAKQILSKEQLVRDLKRQVKGLVKEIRRSELTNKM